MVGIDFSVVVFHLTREQVAIFAILMEVAHISIHFSLLNNAR